MKKSVLLVALSLILGIGTISADNHRGNSGHKTEQNRGNNANKNKNKDNKHNGNFRPGNKGNNGNHNGNYKPGNNGNHYGSSAVRPGYGAPPAPAIRPVGRPIPPKHMRPVPPKVQRPWVAPMPNLNLAYAINAANVIFNGLVMRNVSIPTFQVLDYGYARDAYNVYYLGRVLQGADPATFEILPNGYARDAWTLYYYGRPI